MLKIGYVKTESTHVIALCFPGDFFKVQPAILFIFLLHPDQNVCFKALTLFLKHSIKSFDFTFSIHATFSIMGSIQKAALLHKEWIQARFITISQL